MSSRPSEMRDRGFTLIELVVVMIVLAILASLAVFSLGGTMDRYQLSRAAETIEMFDAAARRDARTSGQSLSARIDRDRGRLTVGSLGNASYRLPGQVKIEEIRMRRRVTAGNQFELNINANGQSPTYAVHLQRRNVSRWLVVLGISGQIITFDNAGEVDAMLSL